MKLARSKYCHFLFFLIAATHYLSCTHSAETIEYGLQPSHAGYVPARIAVLPCRMWPNGARYKSLPLSNTNQNEIQKLCEVLDGFVIGGFENQPYMRGYSPQGVAKLLQTNNNDNLLSEIEAIWNHSNEDCGSCINAPSFYIRSITKRENWRLWLNTLSQNVRKADAVLLPFIVYSYDTRYEDRGLVVAKRAVGSVLLLVSTTNGDLLWSGAREASSVNQRLNDNHPSEDLPFPEWTEVYDRAFRDDLWLEFPGRQIYK